MARSPAQRRPSDEWLCADVALEAGMEVEVDGTTTTI